MLMRNAQKFSVQGAYRLLSLVLSLAGLLLLSACTRATPPPDPTATPSPMPTNTLQATIIVVEGTEMAVVQPANPSATPNFEIPNPVRINELQFIQNGHQVQMMAKLQNILNDALLRDISFEFLLLDVDGNRLASTTGAVKYIFARETTGVVMSVDLTPGMIAANLQMQITGGKEERGLTYTQPFTITQSRSAAKPNGQFAYAWLENRDKLTYTQVSLNAIAYNKQGEIICGGAKPQEFVPSSDKIGVSVPLTNCPSAPAVVDLYAFLTHFSGALDDGSWQENIEVRNWDFIVSEKNQLAGGIELRNKTDRTLTKNYFILTAYSDTDQVCLAENRFLDALWPSEESVYSPGLWELPLDCEARGVKLKVLPGEFGSNPLAYNPLAASPAGFYTDESGAYATLRLVNNLNTVIPSAYASVVVKDATGKIVGGGGLNTEPIPANGMLEVKVPIAFIGELDQLNFSASGTIPDGVSLGN